MTPYLGLSIPYPADVPSLPLTPDRPAVKSHSMQIYFVVDKKGKVKKVEYPSDSAAFIEPILKDLKKIKFLFTEGRNLDFPLMLPAEIIFPGSGQKLIMARLKFPVSPQMISNPELLAGFFAANDVKPPEVVRLNPIFYRVDDPLQSPDYLTITARVFLDEAGELEDISFPISGQDANTHQVQMAIMNARFEPAMVKSQPVACDFLLAFRIFTNLKYPYSPSEPPDSTVSLPFTARYFMTLCLNEADISTPALPRNHGAGQIQAASLGLGRRGVAELFVNVDTTGNIIHVLNLGSTPDLGNRPERAIKLVKWYPATDRHETARPFAGKISMVFDGSTRIVYIPEWLKP